MTHDQATTIQRLTNQNNFEISRLKADLEFSEVVPESTIAHQLYLIHLGAGADPERALFLTVEDRKEDLAWDIEFIVNN